MGCNCGKKKQYEVLTAHEAETRRQSAAAAAEETRIRAAQSEQMRRLADAENARQAAINANLRLG